MKNTSAITGWNNSSSTNMELTSKAEGIFWCTAFALEAVLIVVGNLLTIVLFEVNKNLRKKSLFLIINMAFADLLLGTAFLPFDIYLHIGDYYQLWAAVSTRPYRMLYDIVLSVLLQASLISAVMVSGERFYAIYFPFEHRTLSMRAYHIVIFTVWTLAVLVSTIFVALRYFVSSRLAFNTLMPYFLFLLIAVCGCNFGFWRKYKYGRIAPQHQNRASQNQRLTKTLLFVSVVALLSWIPFIMVNLILSLGFELSISFRIYYMTKAMNYSSSFLNPVIYALRIPEFRHMLGFFRYRKQGAIQREGNHRRYNRAAASTLQHMTNVSHARA